MENRKKLRVQIARLTAIFYLMFVVASDMAAAGFGVANPVEISNRTSAGDTVTIENASVMRDDTTGPGCSVKATVLDSGNKVIALDVQVVSGTFVTDDDQIGIYSVRDNNGREYFYTNKQYDESVPGLYYSNGWKLVCESAVSSLSVQLTYRLLTNNTSYYTIYNSNMSVSGSVGSDVSLSSIKSDLESALNNNLAIYYYDYTGAGKTATYKSGTTSASSSCLGYDNLRFTYTNYDAANSKYVFSIGYGGVDFVNANEIRSILTVWKSTEPDISVYRQSGTNQVMVNTNMGNTTGYAQVTGFLAPSAYGTLTPAKEIAVSATKVTGSDIVTLPEEGIYLPGIVSGGAGYHVTAAFAAHNGSSGAVTDGTNKYQWYGPASSDLGKVTVGTRKNITDNLKDTNGQKGDYAGCVTKVGSTTVTADTPYKDEYVMIDYYGNVTVLKSGSAKSYTLTTQTKYTKFKKVSSDGVLGYYNGTNDSVSYKPEDIQYDTQEWNVSLAITPTGSASETTTTKEPVTTTESPEPGTTTEPSYTAALSVSSGGNVGDTKIKVGGSSSIDSVTAKQGDTITVTTTDNDYNKDPVVELVANGTTKELSSTTSGVTRTYTFTMPAAAATVKVWYKAIDSVSVTSSSVSSGGTKAYGNSEPTKEELAKLCSASATYIDKSTSKRRKTESITLSASNVTLGTATYKDSGVTRTYTVPVTVSASKGGKTGSFSFQYTYTDNIGHNIKLITKPSGITNTTTLSSDTAAKGDTITVTVTNTETACDPTLYYKAGSAQYNMTKGSTSGNTVNYTFVMPDSDVEVYVTYKKLSSFTVKAPTRKTYDTFTEAGNLSVEGGSLTPVYKDEDNNTYTGSAISLTNDMLSLGNASSTSENGTTIYTIPVHVTYNNVSVKEAFTYTYEVVNKYKVNCSSANGPVVKTDKSTAVYGETVTVTLPEDSTNRYAFPTLSVVAGTDVISATRVNDTTYRFTMPAEDVTVTANYKTITNIEITPPTISASDSYSENTKVSDLPLGTIKAVYGSGSNAETISIPMTTSMYTVETKTEKIEGTTVTVTVPVTITVNYGGLLRSSGFSYQYTYEKSASSKEIVLDTVTPADMKVNVSKTYAEAGETISVVAEATPEYAFATITARTASGTDITVSASTEDGRVTGTFTMPDEKTNITVSYKSLTSITVTPPEKLQYDSYVDADALDLKGGVVAAVYGSSSYTRTVSMQEAAGVVSDCLVTCMKDDITTETVDSYMVYTVPVRVTYGGMMGSFSYTYKESMEYSIGLNLSPSNYSNADSIKISETNASYGETVQVTLPPDTDEQYAFPELSYTVNGVTSPLTQVNGIYSFKVTGDTVVNVSYSKISKIEINVPNTKNYNGFVQLEDLDISGVSAKAVYENGESRNIPISRQNISYSEEVQTEKEGCITHTIPVNVEVLYGQITANNSYKYTYMDYRVVLTSNVEGDTVTSVSKDTAKTGDTLLITTDTAREIESVRINGKSVKGTTNPISVYLNNSMLSDKGYEIVVRYKIAASIVQPESSITLDTIFDSQGVAVEDIDFGTNTITVYYDEYQIEYSKIPINSDIVKKELVGNPVDTDMGTYIQRTMTIKLTVDNQSTNITVIAKIKKNKVNEETPATTTQQPPSAGTTGNQQEDTLKTPEPVEITKVAVKKKKITVTWKNQENATSYEIYMSTSKNSGYQKIKTVKKTSSKAAYSYTIKTWKDKALKKNKKYYIKIRAVNGIEDLSETTTIKTVKCKKTGKLSVSFKSTPNAVSYRAMISLKKNKGYKKAFTLEDTGKKKYSKTIAKCGGSKVKKGKKYYVKVVTTVDNGDRVAGAYSSVSSIKCK